MKAFLLSFNASLVPRNAMLDFLDTLPDVLNWYAFGEAGVFIVSKATASQLSAVIHNRFHTLFFVVTEVSPGTTDGWQPKAAWDFINFLKASGRWPGSA